MGPSAATTDVMTAMRTQLRSARHLHVLKVLLDSFGVASGQLREELDGLIGLGQLLVDQTVLLLELFDKTHLGVVVLHWLVRNVASLTRILECVNVFLDVQIARVQTSDHQAVAVTAQTMPQQRGQFGFAIGNIGNVFAAFGVLTGGQGSDYLSQRKQTLVNVD